MFLLIIYGKLKATHDILTACVCVCVVCALAGLSFSRDATIREPLKVYFFLVSASHLCSNGLLVFGTWLLFCQRAREWGKFDKLMIM